MATNSKGKLEAEISTAYIKFQREILGRGPKETKTYIIGDMVIIRMKGVLTHEEKLLVQAERGKQIVKEKRQFLREQFHITANGFIENLTGCTVISNHSDLSTRIDEQVEMFIMDCDLEKKI